MVIYNYLHPLSRRTEIWYVYTPNLNHVNDIITAHSHTPITKYFLTIQEVTALSMVKLPIYLSQDLRFPGLVFLTLQPLPTEGIYKIRLQASVKTSSLRILFKDCSTEASKSVLVTR